MKQFIRNNRLTQLVLALIRSMRWLSYYLKYSATLSRNYVSAHSRAKILKEAHTLEKGLSFASIRPYYGATKRANLISEVERSRAAGDNSVPCSIAAGVIAEYVAWHKQAGHVNAEVLELEKLVCQLDTNPDVGGGTLPYRPDYTGEQRRTYDQMVMGRRSVRNFRADPVPIEILRDAIRVANFSPSVCNRQSWAVSVVQNPMMVRKMLSLQNGNTGFNQTIGNIIVILADVRGFLDEYEMFEPFVDAGIFSGALVNALNAHNIGSCCLNLCVSHHMALRVVNALDLEPGLFPIMMIACGYVADDCRVAMSSRLEPTVFVH